MHKYTLSSLLLLLLIFSCEKESFLMDIDKEALFSSPLQSEVEAVRTEWASRNLMPTAYTVEQSQEVLDNRATLKIVSYLVQGQKEFAALIIPNIEVEMPIRFFLNGFSKETIINSLSFLFNDEAFNIPFIIAIPALRGQSLDLTIKGSNFTSPTSDGIHCDAFDGATDGVIALLNGIEANEPLANTNRVSAQGGSRGGTVAMLMAIRDDRVKRVVSVAGPTNMLELTSQNENDGTYQCQFLTQLVDEEVTFEEARLHMIASSPIFFAEDLPLTQLHLGADDQIVPASQGESLDQKLIELDRASRLNLFIYEGRDHRNLGIDNEQLSQRISDFLRQL